MLPKAVCPACVESLRKQGIQNPVVEFTAVSDRLWKCNNCWHLVSDEALGDLVELQDKLAEHDRARDRMLMQAMMGARHAPAPKN